LRCIKIEDFIENLKRDELAGSLYGTDNQLEILGWHRKTRLKEGEKVYVTRCLKCAEDPELFGEAYFECTRGDLKRLSLPCGCGKSPRWTEAQYKILCERKCNEIDINFLGWVGEFTNNSTKCLLECKEHGVWRETTIGRLLYSLKMCFKCSVAKLKVNKFENKPDSEMIANFISTGSFPDGTTFKRSVEPQKWVVYCPVCKEENTAFLANVYKGRLPCSCSKNPKIAYINLILDNEHPLALKFGITNNLKSRLYLQNKNSVYKIDNIGYWTFTESKYCKSAERQCLESLECGILTKAEMADGFTETTSIYNLDKIISIYETSGGLKNDRILH